MQNTFEVHRQMQHSQLRAAETSNKTFQIPGHDNVYKSLLGVKVKPLQTLRA
jgi:hypothetical protein